MADFTVELADTAINFKCKENQSVLDAALDSSVTLEYSCKTGECGVCEGELINGELLNEEGNSVKTGKVLLCQTKALTNCEIKANYYPELSNITIQLLPCKVQSVIFLTQDIIELVLRLPPNANFNYLAGQYIDLIFGGIKRSYSIASAQTGSNSIKLHIRRVENGKMSELLFNNLKNNQLMRLEGPKGTFFVKDNSYPLIFIATGTGIAPILSMVEELNNKQDNRELHIYWGMRYKNEIYCKELIELARLEENIHFKAVLSRDNTSYNLNGYVQEHVCSDFDSLENYQVYACGSIHMIKAAKQSFMSLGLKENNFYSDAFVASE